MPPSPRTTMLLTALAGAATAAGLVTLLSPSTAPDRPPTEASAQVRALPASDAARGPGEASSEKTGRSSPESPSTRLPTAAGPGGGSSGAARGASGAWPRAGTSAGAGSDDRTRASSRSRSASAARSAGSASGGTSSGGASSQSAERQDGPDGFQDAASAERADWLESRMNTFIDTLIPEANGAELARTCAADGRTCTFEGPATDDFGKRWVQALSYGDMDESTLQGTTLRDFSFYETEQGFTFSITAKHPEAR